MKVIPVTSDVHDVLAGLVEVSTGPTTLLTTTSLGADLAQITASSSDGRPLVRVKIDLATAVAYWQPGGRAVRALPPDWAPPARTSLVQSAPAGAVYDAAGRVLLGWAADENIGELSVRAGVSEEGKSFVVEVEPVRPQSKPLTLLIDGRSEALAPTVQRLAAWLSANCDGTVLQPTASTRTPVYSTWYTFAQDITDDRIEVESEHAVAAGFGSVFIDDGWQQFGHGRGYQGCGDWVPDAAKFTDLAATVKGIRARGACAGLWIAPLLLGRESQTFGEMEPFAPAWQPTLNCHVLDPRLAEVREHVAQTCLRLVRDYGADLLKIDFLDQAMVYHSDAAGAESADTTDVGWAMAAMLELVRHRLAEAGQGHVAFEFRQPYVNPAIARFGEILRANDCPADSIANRTATVDLRLFAVGQVVHADPMMWGTTGGAEAVAQQIYAGWFAVPQVSMRLTELAPVQTSALAALLRLWRDQVDVILDGTLEVVGAERGYDLVRAVRHDLNRAVAVRYSPVVVDISPIASTTVINATADNRLVLHSSEPISGGVINSVDGQRVGPISPAAAGWVCLDVPAYGTAVIQVG